ncbi:hypothetical protein DCC27_008775 [Auritidibacter sp. NML130574]|uniref:D-alanyl-D-alanine carboxypeptidase/D-alanyl-D-alanine-endopeptidase n=1 Tax=Auritidibacter sp. NML130574 TaxID=2170745 RepID=UPI000D72A0B0|nr:D-alanyl-D-alanine carboxypeptidase [Auritidibacter sp. NML130574]AXR74368.1 hypothetical protein DCC27_008775 [Auritidibacter sp. NML130574]
MSKLSFALGGFALVPLAFLTTVAVASGLLITPTPALSAPKLTIAQKTMDHAEVAFTDYLQQVEETSAIDPQALESQLGGTGSADIAMMVVDGYTGDELYSRHADDIRTPASSLKLISGVAILDHLDPAHRFTTTVSVTDHQLTIHAGGDALMGVEDSDDRAVAGRAGLKTLAEDTLAALDEREATGEYTVAVEVADYQQLHPDWEEEGMVTSGNISQVTPIATFGARAHKSSGTDRVHDPAGFVASTFQQHLDEALPEDSDLTVTLADQSVTTETVDGEELASAESATVAEQLAYGIEESDNQIMEVLARQAAMASGFEPNVTGVQQMITETVDEHGLSNTTIADASGLSSHNLTTASDLVEIVETILTTPELSPIDEGLPVAGSDGTLATRMDEGPTAGTVRAKTGTLAASVTLSGITTTQDGRPVYFVLISPQDIGGGGILDARSDLDQLTTALTSCGC